MFTVQSEFLQIGFFVATAAPLRQRWLVRSDAASLRSITPSLESECNGRAQLLAQADSIAGCIQELRCA